MDTTIHKPEHIKENLDERIVSSFFENNDFFLVYQKKVNLLNPNDIIAFEAFLRLRTASLDSFSPAIFMPVVERMGLMGNLNQVIVNKITEDWSLMQLIEYDIPISLNINLRELKDLSLLQSLLAIIDKSPMPCNQLIIDIIDDSVSLLPEILAGTLLLHQKGIRFCLDIHPERLLEEKDLSNLPLSELKLPRSLINNSEIITHYKTLSEKLGCQLTAVGIEKQQEQDLLTTLGIKYGQGFLYGKLREIDQLKDSDNGHTDNASKLIHLFIIESSNHFTKLLRSSLPENFHITSINYHDDPDLHWSEQLPDIIVADISDNADQGFELIEKLKQNHPNCVASPIFIADNISSDQHLKSYELNSFAFLLKNAPIIELISAINRAMNIQLHNKNLLKQVEETSQLAMQSMRDASQYGDIVQLIKKTSQAKNESSISRALFNYLNQRQLKSSVVFRDGDSILSFDSTRVSCSPTELNVFEILKSKGRLYSFGDRLIINGKHCSFLIKNMPHDELSAGQIRDYVAVIIECMDARCHSILQNRAIEKVISELIEISTNALSTVEKSSHRKKEMINYLNTEIGLSFHVLDLTIDQEDYLKDLVSKLVTEQDFEEENNSHIVDQLNHSVKTLSAIFDASESVEENEHEAEDALFDDDELF